jgi:hypothetical protein
MGVVVPLFVVGFFAAAIVAVAFGTTPAVRRTYLAGFFTVFITVNLFVSAIPAPVVHWHKFSGVRDETQTDYEIRIVDAGGDEIAYDSKATLGANGIVLTDLLREMRTEHSEAENREVFAYLFEKAQRYRDNVERRPPSRFLRFPPHSTTDVWTPETLDDVGEFVELRVYRVDLEVSSDGREVVSHEEQLVMAYDAPTERIRVPAPEEVDHARRSSAAAPTDDGNATTDDRNATTDDRTATSALERAAALTPFAAAGPSDAPPVRGGVGA